MASIKFLEGRIASGEAKILKLSKKLERIEAAKATNWEKNPYYYTESDLRWAAQDLAEAKASLGKYQAQLAEAQQKAASRNVTAILEFLEQWKGRCLDFYGKGLKAAYDELDAIRALESAAAEYMYGSNEYECAHKEIEARHKEYRIKLHGKTERRVVELHGRKITQTVKVETGEWEYIHQFMKQNYENSMKELKELLNREAERKYDFIIERTCAIVGAITDASGLSVGSKGDLNGVIIGTEGRASVNTIGAGGYNIQVFHFRTLIKRL